MTSFVVLCIFLGIGHILRRRICLFRKLYLPSCVIGGLAGLLLIQILKGLSPVSIIFESCSSRFNILTESWHKLPSILINIVFACLFLGVKLPKLSDLWKQAGPQIVYGPGKVVLISIAMISTCFCLGWIMRRTRD